MVIISGIFLGIFLGSVPARAGSQDLEADKRTKFEDDSVESMRDVFMRREEESREYREKILANSEKTIKLLEEIKELLQRLNEKK